MARSKCVAHPIQRAQIGMINRLPVNGAIAIDKVRELEGRMQAQSSQVKQEQTLEALNDIVKEAIRKTETKGQVIDIEPVPEKDRQA